MLCVPCYVLLCHAHILEGLYDLISVESNRLLGIRIRLESSRFESIRQIFHLPAHLFASSAKRTSGESEVFDPLADSNHLCFKTIRLSLDVLDMLVSLKRPTLKKVEKYKCMLCSFKLHSKNCTDRNDCTEI